MISPWAVLSSLPKARSAAGLKLIFQTEPLGDCPKAFPLLLSLRGHFFKRCGSKKVIFHVFEVTLKCFCRVISLGTSRAGSDTCKLVVKPLGNADDAVG